jgi:hypothetical protein
MAETLDRLVSLYRLPPLEPHLLRVQGHGITVRAARAYEKHPVTSWVRETFGQGWSDECEATFSREPISCQIATLDGNILGFCCYEATCRDFCGPLGVAATHRGKHLAPTLLLACLHAMRAMGYAYAILGGVGDAAPLFRRFVHAMDIPGSHPGIYIDPLRAPQKLE